MPRPATDPRQLRVTWEQAWSAADRAWEQLRDWCQCRRPRRGPRYLGSARCTVCGRKVE
jgi:hypothetical protein